MMSNSIRALVLIFPLLLHLHGCGATGAPNCSDKEVQDLVMEITEGELAKQGYNSEAVAEFGLELSAIRTNSKDEEAKKCSCGGTLSGNRGDDLHIEYTAQHTEDNQIYVEVFGL